MSQQPSQQPVQQPSQQLADKRCVPCEGGMPPLPQEEVERLLGQVRGWKVEEGKQLVKAFRFKDFLEAVALVNAITPVAEAEGHRPDLLVRWGEVRVTLWT